MQMLKIALSGNIGCGKSTFGAYLASYGAYVVEVDELMHRLLHFDTALSVKLKATFAESLFENQAFSEQKSKAYFSENIKSLEQFHKIVNPYVEKAAAEKLRHAKLIKAPYFVLVSPDISIRNYLGIRIFDYSVKVNCSLENQFKRLKSRSSQDDQLILDLMSRNSKIKHSQADINYNISNDLDLNYLKLSAKSLHNKLLKTPSNYFKIQLKSILVGGIFCSTLAGAQSIYPSCMLAGTCVIPTNQTSTVSSTTDNQNFILNSGVSVSTTLNAPAFNLLNNGTSLINNGTITTTGNGSNGAYATINSPGLAFTTLGSIINNGVITNTRTGGANAPAINLWGTSGAGAGSGSLDSLVNNSTGEISTSVGNAILLHGNGLITTLTNFGSISTGGDVATYFGISNTGSITTLNNAQGAGNAAGALTYKGTLPTNYNIIINSPTSFGKLAVTSGAGTTTFGIYTGSTVRNGTYASVLSGVTSSNLNNTTGTFGSATWLLSNSSSDIWDLIISGYYSGPSVANTNQSLVNTASALQGTYTLQNSVLANSFSYDCTVFGANDVCVSAGGRNTQVQAANGLNNTSALLIAAYRPHPNYRIGAYADQNLSVSNPGGTVNLGNNTPLLGLFAAWNERLDGTGTEVKVSAAYGQKNTTMTRSVVGSGATASEAGSGSSTLNSQGVQATAKYGFSVLPEVIVSPYVGARYTSNTMGGYTEATSSSVTAPLTYSALNTNATTALAGVGASYRVIPTVMTFASAGVETDTNTANGTYSATNSSIGTLTPVNFNANPVKTRPTATVGAYYDIEKNQRLGITGIYRQEAYQAVSTTTVMATYTIGL
ncbi:dephospho-CoA kinase [Polynucleobacter paneuropaeus]|nr:dephospho-CoA kinase [Polynucleobacter paneuropaeus]MBT8600403.1 dephospho-CoA kinase [Polynucleobacter paneuropaeus]